MTGNRSAPSEGFESLAPAASSRVGSVPPAQREDLAATRQGAEAPNGVAQSRRAGKGVSLKARAINYLARREHSRHELARKLAPHVPPDDPDALPRLLDELERDNWLSDQRFAHSTAHRRGAGRGTALVMQELHQHGLAASDLETVREQLRGTELQRARDAWRKKFGQIPADAKAYARQARFMASRGFSHETFRRVLAEQGSDLDGQGI